MNNSDKMQEMAVDPVVLKNLRDDLGLGSLCDSKSPDNELESLQKIK